MTREVHWERRERAARTALRGLLSNQVYHGAITKTVIQSMVEQAVAIGDALIDELDKAPACTTCGKPCDRVQFVESVSNDRVFCSQYCLLEGQNNDDE